MRQFPEIVSGYELTEAEFGIIVPTREDTTNLVENPSLETNVDGFNAMAGAVARVAQNAAFGTYALKCTPAVGLNDGCYYEYISLENEHQYFFSVYFYGGDIGQKYRIYFADNIGGRKGAYKEFKATGQMQRIFVSWSCEYTSDLFRVYVVKSNHAGIVPFYCDGFQVEESFYTTYIDGDRHGFLADRADYYWNGIAHESTSVRIAQSRHGGREMKLRDLGFSLLAMVGLGLGGFQSRYPALATGGEFYDGTFKVGRNFALVGAVTGSSYNVLRGRLGELYELFSPDYVSPTQPVNLTFRDKRCGENSLFFTIPCVFEGGLDDELNNYHQQRISLNFHAYLPHLTERETEVGYQLGFSKYFPNADPAVTNDNIVMRKADGSFLVVSTGEDVIGMEYYRGEFYYCTVTTLRIKRINPDTGIITDVAALDSVANVFVARGDYLYIGGLFTTIDGNPFLRVARWDGTTWTALGTGINNNTVYDMAFSNDGTLYIAGSFTFPAGNIGICYYRDGTYYPMDGGVILAGADAVLAVAIGKDGKVWIGGKFTSLNDGGTVVGYVTYWENGTFANIIGVNSYVTGITIDDSGKVYIGGAFSTYEGGPANAVEHIAYWDGNLWQQLGQGIPDTTVVWEMAQTLDGIAIGFWRTDILMDPLGDYPVGYSIWNGSTLVPFDIESYCGWDVSGHHISLSSSYLLAAQFVTGVNNNISTAEVTEIVNNGNVNSYPIITFKGPGVLRSIKNLSTGKYIWFHLILQDGEAVELSLDPSNLFMNSNLRGNVLESVIAGSNLTEFYLKPGKNNISLFISKYTGANTGSSLRFTPKNGSLP